MGSLNAVATRRRGNRYLGAHGPEIETLRARIARPSASRRSAFPAVLIATGAVMLAACGGDGDAASRSDGSVVVTDVWARATPPGTTVGAVYLTATSDTADSLTGADVDPAIAASATLHSTETSGGMSTMTAQSTLEIPTGDVLALEPSGSHIMLVDLTGPLESGTTFDLTLHFEQAGDETVTVEVRDDAP